MIPELETMDYQQLPYVEWDGKSPLAVWQADLVFRSEQEVLDYCQKLSVRPDDLRLLATAKQFASPVDPNALFADLLPEGIRLEQVCPVLWAAFHEVNHIIHLMRVQGIAFCYKATGERTALRRPEDKPGSGFQAVVIAGVEAEPSIPLCNTSQEEK